MEYEINWCLDFKKDSSLVAILYLETQIVSSN